MIKKQKLIRVSVNGEGLQELRKLFDEGYVVKHIVEVGGGTIDYVVERDVEL